MLQLVRLLTHRHRLFLHRFQKRRLRFRRRAVDFVRKNDIGENRTWLKVQKLVAMLVFLNYIGSDDVGRHQVRSELNSR